MAFVHGLLLSLGLILPIGMQNGFILTQAALHSHWSESLPAVLTAAICDTLLIALAVIGVSTLALEITWVRDLFGVIGILFLAYMGWSTWRARVPDDDHPSSSDNHASSSNGAKSSSTAWTAKRQIGFATSVSLLNPHALIDTLAVIGGSAVAYTAWTDRIAFGVASAAVSWLWFFMLSIVGHMLGKVALGKSSVQVLNKVSAIMMWASAIYLAYVVHSFK